MATANDILIRILGDSAGLKRELRDSSGDIRRFSGDVQQATRSLGAFGNVVTGIFQGIGQAIAGAAANGLRSAVGQIGTAITAASNLNESLSKTNVAFGDSAREIVAWSQTSARAFGQSQQQALEAASSFGLLFSSMGVGRQEAAAMSRALVELASDIASINNLTPEDALLKLRAGLVGETEPLRTVGVLLNAATVEAKALEMGLAGTAQALTEQDKVLARYQLILAQTALTQGDFARTSDQAANSERILAATLEDSAARIGRFWLPVRTAFVKGVTELIATVAPYGESIMDSLAAGLARGITSILPVLAQLRALFVYWLKPGSPPRLLKELTDWGAGAMQAYLDGWGEADFRALEELGGTFESILRSFAASGDIAETDLVSRVFGTQRALTRAIADFRNLGSVSQSALDGIADAAGPAGREVADLLARFFDLERATQKVVQAQDELNSVTRRYGDALNPLNRQLSAVRARQQDIRDNQQLEELGQVLRDPRADADQRELARLQIQEIQLERQARAIEAERDTAVEAAQAKIDAAKAEQDAQQQRLDVAKASLEQQAKTNALIAEETALRKRLIDEGIAEQKRVLAELEAAQRKTEQAERERLAGLERIANAELRYRLATTDTAGQLAIWQDELGKVAEGSAEYYDILTQIASLNERLGQQQAGTGGLLPDLAAAVAPGGELTQASEGVAALTAALDEAFKVLAGTGGQQVQLAPAWQQLADTVSTIGQLAEEATPRIQALIDVIFGKEVGGTEGGAEAGGADPFAGNFWLAGLIPFMEGLTLSLQQLQEGDWAGLWSRFKAHIDSVLTDPATDPEALAFYTWFKETLIPAWEAVVNVDWAGLWDAMTAKVDESWSKVKASVDLYVAGIKLAIDELKKLLPDWEWGGPDTPMPKGPKGPQDLLPGSPNASFGGSVPALGLAGTGNMTVNNYQIYQTIGTNGDFGGARQGATEGIREAIIRGRLA